MSGYTQTFALATSDGNQVSLGGADNGGIIVGVQIKGEPFAKLARLSADEARQFGEILDILLTKPPKQESKIDRLAIDDLRANTNMTKTTKATKKK